MRPPRRPRSLSREDAHLWGEIAKLITPLRARVTLRKAKPVADATPAARVPRETTAKVSPANNSPADNLPARNLLAKNLPTKNLPTKNLPTKRGPAAKPAPSMPSAILGPVAVVPPAKAPKRVVRLGAGAPPVSAPAAPARPAFVPAPAPPGLERRERQRLSRGLLAIEGRIDLHGLYQAEAHAALVGFLMRARAAGHARVLVVTGKGARMGAGMGGADAHGERGVLRRSVPHWLRGADLRPIVLGFEEAARHHGGAGALYVRLRRR